MSQVNRVISLTMSENLLGGLMMAVSLANAILLIWLGLTVLLNSERRTWGMWLAGGSLLTGGAFFLIQSAVAGRGPSMPWRVPSTCTHCQAGAGGAAAESTGAEECDGPTRGSGPMC